MKVVAYCSTLPKTYACEAFSRQLIRSASSVGANYRAACRAKSDADFVNKLKIVEEEADESGYWLELLAEMPEADSETAVELAREAAEFLAITVASIKTVRNRQANRNRKDDSE